MSVAVSPANWVQQPTEVNPRTRSYLVVLRRNSAWGFIYIGNADI